MRLTLGINNCFAVKRWPQADEWAQIVSAELGLEFVQHSLDLSDLQHEPEAEAEAVNTACARAGVRIGSVFTGLAAYSTNMMLAPTRTQRERGVAFWSEAIRFAAQLGAETVGGHVGSLSRRDANDPARRDVLWQELGEHLERLRRQAREDGVGALLVENMACDREPCRMPELESLMRDPDPERSAVSLCLDIGHQCVPGTDRDEADPYVWLRRLGARAAVVHLQQSDAEADHHWPFTPQYNERGRIRAERVLEALAASGASDAALVLEVIPPFESRDEQVLNDLRASVDYWQRALVEFERDAA